MALPSQFSRTGGGRTSRKRQIRRRRILFLIFLVAVAIVVYFLFFNSKDTESPQKEINESVNKKFEEKNEEESKVISSKSPAMGAGHNPYDGSIDEKQGDINLTDTEIKPVLVDTSPYKKLLEKSEELFVEKEYVAARLTASNLALDQSVPESIRKAARGIAVEVGKFLTFSPLVLESDPFSIRYEVKTGDNLTSIRNQNNLKIPYGLIRRINNLNNSDIFPGQTLKLLKGPFRVIIEKKNYRMDIIQGDKDSQVLVASYPVGLGEYNSTPIGLFAVDGDKRIKDPSWTNPRTGEFMSASDPKNPVGEYYIGLKGLEERTKDLDNYAIHGTIEPDSIGTDSSMGCIRLHSDIIPIVFDMLYGTSSTVEVIGK